MSQPTLSRRSVTAGLAWSVPVVAAAVAAPAFAASPRCYIPTTAVWNSPNYVRQSDIKGVFTTADPDGAGSMKSMTLTVETVRTGDNIRRGDQAGQYNDNLRAATGATIGGAVAPLVLHQSPKYNVNKSGALTTANSTTTRFTFSQPVTSLSFTITDIDSTTDDFYDAVAITSSTPYTWTKKDSSFLYGTGSLTDPWHPRYNDTGVPDSSTTGNVTITFTQPVTTFDLVYWNITPYYDPYIDGDQRVFVSNLQFTYNACPTK